MPSFANSCETSVSMIHAGDELNREPGAADSDSSVIDEEIVSNSRGSGVNIASMVERRDIASLVGEYNAASRRIAARNR